MNIFPKIAANNGRTPQCKSRTVTHFAVPEAQYKEAAINGYTSSPSKPIEQVPLNERLSTVSNESVEFPSFYDTNQVEHQFCSYPLFMAQMTLALNS